ncbi:SDR family NAD(P)-dependent oxidoreductase [Chryseobacterium sp. RP-3-3]|uniref:SDR family NAD(P)-dependent oxidoreductase n=2 Tax=Chryseobacterium antibioticum TaxID=2728847 RepID=A0A7Y0AKD9_9FLAO|nr:SDR family NAD(P)-dependent oxidoreductase [Chryseobacterium antibioticum]
MKAYLENELIELARRSLVEKTKKTKTIAVHKAIEPSSEMHLMVIERELTEQLAALIKLPLDKIDVSSGVSQYGMDSLLITEFIKRISAKFLIELHATVFFEARNLKRLAEIILQKNPKLFQKTKPTVEMTHTVSSDFGSLIEAETHVEEKALLEKYRGVFSREQAVNKQNIPKEEKTRPPAYEPIAIIGIDGMFAKSRSAEELWEHLRNEDNCIDIIPIDRWKWENHFGNPQKENKTNVKWGGFIPEIDQFDPDFFTISPKEAELMDPQHRLFLQSVWKAIYRSGYSTASLSSKKIAVFLGINLMDYQLRLQQLPLDAMNLTASSHVFCPSRIAFQLNLNGPCHVIDTACSSSLVAIHRAALAIQNEGCEMAIAGAANIMMDPMMHIQYAKTGMICQDGRCKTFSKEANGYVRGDGVGAVILKKLSAAERDNDPILGIIVGSAENHGGASASLTAPNPLAQAELIKETIRKSSVDPRTISYIEAHGTGTALGDPIEINGMKMAFSDLFSEQGISNPPSGYCKIGSVKTNIGHAETAAGLAGLTKVLYSMKHRYIPKSLHSEEINPMIDLKNTPFTIAQNGGNWEEIQLNGKKHPLTAGISSFGAGGSNAHILVTAYRNKDEQPVQEEKKELIVPVSAKSEESLKKYIVALQSFLLVDSHRGIPTLSDILKQELLQWFSGHLSISQTEIRSEMSFEELNVQQFDLITFAVHFSDRWHIDQLQHEIINTTSIGHLITHIENRWRKELQAFYQLPTSVQTIRTDISLRDLAYTLQVGRDEFQYRLAFITNSIEDLLLQLIAYLDNGSSPKTYFEGNTRKDKVELLLTGEAGKAYIDAAVRFSELNSLAGLWTKGAQIDWKLFHSSHAKKIELPPYQFKEKRFWIEADDIKVAQITEKQSVIIQKKYDSVPAASETGTMSYYQSTWKQENLVPDAATSLSSADTIVLVDVSEKLTTSVSQFLNCKILHLSSTSPVDLFEGVKNEILKSITGKSPLNLTVAGLTSRYHSFGFLRGLIKSAEQECSWFTGRILGVEDFSAPEKWVEILKTELKTASKEISYQGGVRSVRMLRSVDLADNRKVSFRPEGVYLITGGFGGLGVQFAQHISRNYPTATIILSGRRTANEIQRQLLSDQPSWRYIQTDVSDAVSVERLISQIKKEYGQLTGIIHAAGVLRDSLLVKKTHEEIKAVFGPKISGIMHLDEATKEESLDFMVNFSSVSAVLGNIGQSDYASANAYLNDYTHYRNILVERGERHGQTLSINWPLWRSGGMQIDESSEQYLKRHWGMEPLPSKLGMEAFDVILKSGCSVAGLVYGDPDILEKKFYDQPVIVYQKTGSKPAIDKTAQEEAFRNNLLKMAADILKLDTAEMDLELEFGEFGFDSISLTQFSNALNETYDLHLMPTIFYNYPTLHELGSFLMEEHADNVVKENISPFEANELGFDIPEEIRTTETGKMRSQRTEQEEVAIIGIAGRLPGAENLDVFWKNLVNMYDAISEVPADRWNWKNYFGDPFKEKNKTRAIHGGFITDIDKFDALFFNISPHEAELMDPQQRITLELVYHLFENAAIRPEDLKGTDTGVFVGVSSTDYSILLKEHADVVSEAHFSTGYSHAVLANRISYLFDLHGPSEAIDTACSSSLVAIHRAVENIRSGYCSMAVAGGVNALLAPDLTLSFTQAGMLSEDGRCKTFDKKANGYVRSEGVGFILLKSLKQAEKDGDTIFGIIKGSNENHGGKANTLTSPNPKAQKDLLVNTYLKSGVSLRDVTYIETHGTGTPLGDPIETEALKAAFREIAAIQNLPIKGTSFCKLGSVKTNIGHLESAAGIAGVLKVILSMQHQILPGNPHLTSPNEYLELEGSPFELVKETQNWKSDRPRIAGVSSFGFGGSNAHVIVQEYPKKKLDYSSENELVVICLSANTTATLQQLKNNYLHFIQENKQTDLKNMAYTLHIGREELKYRWAAVVSDMGELKESLYGSKQEREFEGIVSKSKGKKSGENQELTELAIAWVEGYVVDWTKQYKNKRPVKLQLPNYPFARNRHWIPVKSIELESGIAVKEIIKVKSSGKLHPLLHQVK